MDNISRAREEVSKIFLKTGIYVSQQMSDIWAGGQGFDKSFHDDTTKQTSDSMINIEVSTKQTLIITQI